MKTYVISLEKVVERRNYILSHLSRLTLEYEVIDAVQGDLLTSEDMEEVCDMTAQAKMPNWLSKSAIGCSLSHLKAYHKLIDSGEKSCFVIEDDVILPENIQHILADLEFHIQEDEIILLYYAALKKCFLSTIDSTETIEGQLYFPLNVKRPITASAYVIGRKAALNIVEKAKPIQVTADCWHHYFELGCFQSFRLLYPRIVGVKNFKSSIDYFQNNSLLKKISHYVYHHKTPVLYFLTKKIREKRLQFMSNQFFLTNEASFFSTKFPKI